MPRVQAADLVPGLPDPGVHQDGETAMNRDVKYSDGTTIDGDGKGNVNDAPPARRLLYRLPLDQGGL